MDWPSLYAIGAFIQALGQNPGLEATLQQLGTAAHVYVGTGLGNIGTLYDASIALDRAQRRWDRFWSEPERNGALRAHLAEHGSATREGVPPTPAAAAAAHPQPEDRQAAVDVWHRYWADRSPELAHTSPRSPRSRRPASPAAWTAARCTRFAPATPRAASCSSNGARPTRRGK